MEGYKALILLCDAPQLNLTHTYPKMYIKFADANSLFENS